MFSVFLDENTLNQQLFLIINLNPCLMKNNSLTWKFAAMFFLLFLVTGCEKDDETQDRPEFHVPDNFSTIQAAIDAASEGDTIIVFPGTYYENIDYKGKNVLVTSTAPENADTVALTVIDGGNNGPVVRFESGEKEGAILYGFTITHGSAGTGGDGGGIRISNGSSPGIKTNVIKNNTARYGGGIVVSNQSEPFISRNTIYQNTTTGGRGAGIYVFNQAAPVITGNIIKEHEGGDGVIHIGGNNAGQNASAFITGNQINNNITDFGTGAIKVTQNSDVLISGNTIANNHGTGDNSAAAITVSFNSTADINNNTINNNTATRAGAIIIYRESVATITDNVITGNIAGDDDSYNGIGGGIMLTYYGSATIAGNSITNNKAWSHTHGGGGIAIYSWGQETTAVIEDNEIINNHAYRRGGGVYVAGSATNVEIKYNIIAGNKAENHTTATGGAMYFGDIEEAIIYGNSISGNHSHWRGGGIFLDKNAVVKDSNGVDWPVENSPPANEPNNIYSNNTHLNDTNMGADVYFDD